MKCVGGSNLKQENSTNFTNKHTTFAHTHTPLLRERLSRGLKSELVSVDFPVDIVPIFSSRFKTK